MNSTIFSFFRWRLGFRWRLTFRWRLAFLIKSTFFGFFRRSLVFVISTALFRYFWRSFVFFVIHLVLFIKISKFWKYAWCHHMWHIVPFDRNKKLLYISHMRYFDSEIRFQKSILTRKYSWPFGFYEKCLCLIVAKVTFFNMMEIAISNGFCHENT